MPLIRKPADPAAASGATDPGVVKADLRAADVEVRWKAARVLGASAEAVDLLGEAAVTESDSRVREAIFTSLARIGTPHSAAALIPHVRADDAERRTGAMDALKAMPGALAGVLPDLLKDRDPDVRLLACDLVRELPSAEATALLVQVLDSETEVNVCAAAVDVIADIGAPEALPALRRCAERLNAPFLDFAIKIACDRIGKQATDRG
jgi:HEAT repeat protein